VCKGMFTFANSKGSGLTTVSAIKYILRIFTPATLYSICFLVNQSRSASARPNHTLCHADWRGDHAALEHVYVLFRATADEDYIMSQKREI
jgi:hypothetical protein